MVASTLLLRLFHPPPYPAAAAAAAVRIKNLKEYLSQFRQLSKSDRRKLLSEVKNILDVGDKSMIGGVDDGRNYYYARKMSDEMQQEEEDDSLLASSEDDGTAMDSRVSSYYSDTSTAFYTNDVSTARTSMYNTADSNYTSDDDNNRARCARKKYAREGGGRGGGIGKRRVGKAAACLSSRERKTDHSRLYQDINNDDDDDDEEEDESEESLVALMNFPCMSYLLCDFKRETKEAKISDQDCWDWNKNGMMKKRADEVESKKVITVERPMDGDRNVQSDIIQVQCGDNHNIAGGKCSPSFSLTSQNGLTV
jgi:hypothetical protein